MKLKISFFLLSIFFFACANETTQEKTSENSKTETGKHANHSKSSSSDTIKGSPHRSVMANLGKAHIHLEYSSPAVRKRVIWGGLVPYGEVWVTGAHNATSISFSEDVKIANQVIKKGKYAFFTIPDKTEWTIILNKNWEQHLADEYDEKLDVLRFKVKPESQENVIERLTYAIQEKSKTESEISMTWEKLKISFSVKNINI